MNSTLESIHNKGNHHIIHSQVLSELSGYKRCIKFQFFGFQDEFPVIVLYMPDDELFRDRKVRKKIRQEILDEILDHREEYEI